MIERAYYMENPRNSSFYTDFYKNHIYSFLLTFHKAKDAFFRKSTPFLIKRLDIFPIRIYSAYRHIDITASLSEHCGNAV